MKLKIQIEMSNSAFECSQGEECARILRKLAETIEDSTHLGGLNSRLMDVNGNRVGEAKVTR